MNGSGCISLLGIAAIIVLATIMFAGQEFQAVTEARSVQVCDALGCHWEIQTVLK